MVNHLPTVTSMVPHYPKLMKFDTPKELQPKLEFDTSTAQLVFIVFMSKIKASG